MRKEYDLSGGVRGKHLAWYKANCPVVVMLSAKAARAFPTSEAVNAVLEPLAEIVTEKKRNPTVSPRQRRKAG